MSTRSHKKIILLVCGGNTCRSPIGKVILEQKLRALGKLDGFEVDSAAYDRPSLVGASDNARAAIKQLFGQDLLASHKAKKLTPELAKKAEIILVMEARVKGGLPREKTRTLKEYAGGSGDVKDPYGGSLDVYMECAHDVSTAFDNVAPKLLRPCES